MLEIINYALFIELKMYHLEFVFVRLDLEQKCRDTFYFTQEMINHLKINTSLYYTW